MTKRTKRIALMAASAVAMIFSVLMLRVDAEDIPSPARFAASSVDPLGNEADFLQSNLRSPMQEESHKPAEPQVTRLMADAPANATSSPASATSSTAASTTTAASSSVSSGTGGPHVPIGTKVFSTLAGAVIGTPVCVVRRSKYEEHYGVEGMCGESKHKFRRTVAGAFWLPFAVFIGGCEAPFDALANGIMYSSEPFSKDQMSLGKLKQNN